jgi:hypothetical protein
LVAAVLAASALTIPAFAAPPAGSAHPAPRHAFTLAHALVQRAETAASAADLVARHPDPSSDDLWVYPNNGTSTPWTARQLAGSQWRFADIVLVGDVNSDGRPDVVARDPRVAHGTLWIYLNNGTATPWTTRTSAGTGWDFTNAMMLGDVTGDGRADLMARDPAVDQGTMYVYPNNGTANPWPSRFWAGTGWNLASTVVLGDVNGDGKPDIVARDSGGALWVYPGNGSPTSNPWTTSRIGAGTGWNLATSLALGDVTGDGRPDVVIRDGTGALYVYPNSGATSGNPFTVARTQLGSGFTFADTLLLADVSGDGRLDLIARPGGDLWRYSGPSWTTRISAGTGWESLDQLAVADVNGDGHPDLIGRNPALDNGTLWLYPGDGAADPWTASPISLGTGWNLADTVLLGDLTGDGHPDVLVRDTTGNLWVYPNSGAPTGNPFTVPRFWAGTGWGTAAALVLADVSSDGYADLVDLEQDGSMWIYLTGSATPIRVTGDWSTTTAMLVADVDGDGRPDLVTRDSNGALWVHPNNGSTTGDPWPTSAAAGTGWQYADLFAGG